MPTDRSFRNLLSFLDILCKSRDGIGTGYTVIAFKKKNDDDDEESFDDQ